MSPLAEQAGAVPAVGAFAAEKLLHEGEVVILAIKPSGWSVLLVSMPVLAAAGALTGAACLAEGRFGGYPATRAVVLLCAAAGFLRCLIACFQWVGRLYLLTNLRVMHIRGVLRPDVAQCPLRRIAGATVAAGPGERLLGVGSLLFEAVDGGLCEPAWDHVASPAELRKTVEEALRRAR